MTINCNVTGAERKRLAQVLGEITFTEPVYLKAPTFAYVIGGYHIDKNGTIECSDDLAQEAVLLVIEKLKEQGFTPEIAEDTAPAETPAETPDVAPEAEPEGVPEDEAMEANVGAETPDVAAPEEDATAGADQPADEADTQPAESKDEEKPADADDTKLTVSIPRAKLADDALERLRTIVSNKEELFKRALNADALPIEVTDEEISFSWFALTGIDGEATAYTQFITALCQMATEQKRVLDKPYDGDNDRFAMRIFMVRLGMKGPEFALARKLMMKRLEGNSGWRYEDSAAKLKNRNHPTWVAVRQLKNVYQDGTRVELIPMSDESASDIHIGDRGAIVGVGENGSVFIKLDNGSAFGIAFASEQTEEDAVLNDPAPFGLPDDIDSIVVPFDTEPTADPEAPPPEDESDTADPDVDALPEEDESDEDED